MKRTCAWCNAYMGEKPGNGETGTTSGICHRCSQVERLVLARDTVRKEKVSWETAMARAGVEPELQKVILKFSTCEG
jgi:hypothetical protein